MFTKADPLFALLSSTHSVPPQPCRNSDQDCQEDDYLLHFGNPSA